MNITLLLLFLIMAGLMYVGMKALVAGGFLFVAWMVCRHFFATDDEREITTQKLADEMDHRGVKLDSHWDVYRQFLPSLGLHLIQFSHPTTLVYKYHREGPQLVGEMNRLSDFLCIFVLFSLIHVLRFPHNSLVTIYARPSIPSLTLDTS